MVCGEPHAPYDRPPLSKELLAGERPADSLRFRDDDWYADHDVELRLGARAAGLDAGARRCRSRTGPTLDTRRLLIATGAAPRRLPALDGFENVLVLRDLPDALALGQRLRPGARLVIVGGGLRRP